MHDAPMSGAPIFGSARRSHRTALALLLATVSLPWWASPLRAHTGAACELNSECDSGEQCRRRVCGPRSMAPIVPDEPQASSRRLSGSSVCMTPMLSCPLPGMELSGKLCFCDTQAGPVGGIVP